MSVIHNVKKRTKTHFFSPLENYIFYRVPLQYVIGEWDFRNLTLEMRPPVFIPRPETEVVLIGLFYLLSHLIIT